MMVNHMVNSGFLEILYTNHPIYPMKIPDPNLASSMHF